MRPLPTLPLAELPTPITRLVEAERVLGAGPLFAKRDDLTSTLYGGNKVRKLEHLLGEARARGAARIVTIGAVGSHHVLATNLFGRREGFEVEAVLVPQPWTPHVEDVLAVGLSHGLVAFGAGSYAGVPWRITQRLAAKHKAYLVAPGGSSVTGSLGYVTAGEELAMQIARGELPRPRAIVVALGSGGTVAGLLVGLLRGGLLDSEGSAPPVSVHAVRVVDPPMTSAATTLALAFSVARRLQMRLGRRELARVSAALRVVGSQLGKGYGHPTDQGARATELAARDGLTLDPTYTAKAFAAFTEAARGAEGPLLFWQTLAAPEPFAKLRADAGEVKIPQRLRRLMVGRPE